MAVEVVAFDASAVNLALSLSSAASDDEDRWTTMSRRSIVSVRNLTSTRIDCSTAASPLK